MDFTQESLPRTRTSSADLYSEIASGRTIDSAIWDEWALAGYPTGIP